MLWCNVCIELSMLSMLRLSSLRGRRIGGRFSKWQKAQNTRHLIDVDSGGVATVGFSSERIKKVFLTVERWLERGGGRFKGPEFWSGISSTFSRQPSSDLSCLPPPPPWPSLTSQYYYDEQPLVELSAPLETTTQVAGKHDNCSNRKGTGVKSPQRSI